MLLTDLLDQMKAHNAYNLHLVTDSPPVFRLGGELKQRGDAPLSAETVADLVLPHLPAPEQERVLSGLGDVEKIVRHNETRYRLHAFRERGRVAATITVVLDRVPTLEDTKCGPDRMPVLQQIIHQKRGLVVVTGLAGSGKSTFLGALMEEINRTRSARILLLSEPEDYDFQSKQSQITQRIIGEDIPDAVYGLRSAFREDVDVVYAGEARDLTAVALSLALAETGHLVFLLMNMGSASGAVARLIESYPETQQPEIRRNLSATLVAVIAQRLHVRAGGKGRVPSHEVLLSSPHIRRMIVEGQADLRVAIEAGRGQGMQTMDDSIARLYENGDMDYETAWAQLEDKERIERKAAPA